jgi:hypothetical protein
MLEFEMERTYKISKYGQNNDIQTYLRFCHWLVTEVLYVLRKSVKDDAVVVFYSVQNQLLNSCFVFKF